MPEALSLPPLANARGSEAPLLSRDRQGAATVRDSALPTRNSALPTRASALPTRDSALPTRDSALPTRDSALPTRDSALPTRDSALPTRDSALPTRDSALPTRDSALPTRDPLPSRDSNGAVTKSCQVRDLGRMDYARAYAVQQNLVERRKRNEIPDQLLFVEHPPVVTMGRNGHAENLLADPELLERAGIAFHHTDRGGDVTYHGPGQIVGYPILDLREWKRDVTAYLRGIEEVLIGALSEFDIQARRLEGVTGAWVSTRGGPAKIAAIGVHLSRWVSSHGFALNVDTDLTYFRYIVPCGLTQPVTSMRELGCRAERNKVMDALARNFARVFEREIVFEPYSNTY